MKKMTKVLLMLSLCFAIAGAAFGIAGICTGFTVEGFLQAVENGDFSLEGPMAVTQGVSELISDTAKGDMGSPHTDGGLASGLGEGIRDIEQSYSDIESVRLQLGAAKCRLILWEEEEWLVKGDNLPSVFTSEKKGNRLEISCTRSGLKLWQRDADAVLDIYIPKNVSLEKVELEAGVGDVSVEEGFLICEKLELQCGVGTCDIYADILGKAEIEGGVGEVHLTLAGKQQDYDYDLECGLGNIRIGENKYDGAGIDRRIENGSDREIRLECGIGNVEIQFTEEQK